MTKEWTAGQYDDFYRQSDEYKKPYRESIYWPLWQEVLKRIPKNVIVVEFGCGTGQFAKALFDRGCCGYGGIDFSEEAVKLAQENVKPSGMFVVYDITKVVVTSDYDYLVCLETLEHIEDDFAVLNRIRPGKHCLISVPNYDGPNHVRHFPHTSSVDMRYGSFFHYPYQIFRLDLNQNQIIWLLDGVRNEYCG